MWHAPSYLTTRFNITETRFSCCRMRFTHRTERRQVLYI